MRVPGIGHFSPVDAVSWVRATSPSELAYRQRTKRPADAPTRPPSVVAPPPSSAANDVRAHVNEAVLGLRRVGEALRAAPAPEANAASGADDTIADAYPGVRGGTITVN